MREFRPLLVVAVAAVAIAPACGGSATPAATGAEHPNGTVRLPTAVVPRISGGDAAERALLHRIVSGLRPTQIRALAVLPLAAPWKGRPGDVELSVSLIPGARGNPLGQWETWIVGGAFHDRSAQLGLPRVRAIVDGQSGSVEESVPHPPAPAAGLAAFRARLLAAVHASGARLLGLRTGRPDGYAGDLWIQVDDPAAFLQRRLRRLDAALSGRGVDGVYLSVFESDGRPLFTSGSSSRMGAGVVGVSDPRYRGCYQFGFGPFTLVPPLPCPANRRPPLSTPPTRPRLTGGETDRSGNTAGIEFVLQNPNGRPITITSIEPHLPPGAPLRLIGVRIQIPKNRSDGTAAELQRPYGPEPRLKPVTVGPGNWIGVALHFRIAPGCANSAGGGVWRGDGGSVGIAYLLDGTIRRANYPGLSAPCAG